MAISSGQLDSLLGLQLDPEGLAALSYQSGTATSSAITTLSARTAAAPYAAAVSLKVTSINDASNTVVVTATINQADPYGYGNGTSSTVPYDFTVIGKSGNDLLLAANGAAATQAVSAAAIAAAVQSNNMTMLDNDLFVMATDGNLLGTAVALPQTLAFSALTPPVDTVAQALAAGAALSSGVTISDSAANLQGNLDAVQALAAAGKIAAIDLTDSGSPTITLSATQMSGDAQTLQDIAGGYQLAVTGVAAASATATAAATHVAAVTVTDSGAAIAANLDALQALLNQGKLAGVTETDSGFANLAITPSQLAGDQGVLNLISGNFTLTEDASAANLTMTGLTGHANTAHFSGQAAQYQVSAVGDGVSFTVTDLTTGRSSIDHLANFTALQFSDFTDFVAQTPGSASVTTGNVTELYGAVFGRLPDAPGLAFYQGELKANPGLSLFSLAQNFLASPEYVNNSAHNYAESAAGDAQFITDAYSNLLHRAPESGAIPYYQNLIDRFTSGLTAGTAAYAAAQAQGHAAVLVGFSQSAEFLGDVQITAAHPADAQHWLILI